MGKRLENECRLRENILNPHGHGQVVHFQPERTSDLATEQSEPFIKLCIQLCKRGIALPGIPRDVVEANDCHRSDEHHHVLHWLHVQVERRSGNGSGHPLQLHPYKQMFDAVLTTVQSDSVLDLPSEGTPRRTRIEVRHSIRLGRSSA